MNIAVFGAKFDTDGVKKGADQFSDAMDKVKKKVKESEEANDSASKTLASLKAALESAGAAFAIQKISGFIKEVTMLASRYDELGVVLTTIGKNAGASQKELFDLEEGLKKTGISALQSRQSITTMIQAQLDLSQATKLARVAQDAAVIGQMNSSDALQRIIHGIKTAQTETLRTVGINVNFEEGYRKLAASMGKNVESLTQAEKAQSRMNSVMESGKQIAGAYEAAMGNAGKQLRSSERYAEDLKVAIGEVFQPAFTIGVNLYVSALKLMKDNIGIVKTVVVTATAAVVIFTVAITALTVATKGAAAIAALRAAVVATTAAFNAGTLASVAFGISLRTALVASGVGALIVGLGFAINALINYFTKAKDKTDELDDSTGKLANKLHSWMIPAIKAETSATNDLVDSLGMLHFRRQQQLSGPVPMNDPSGVDEMKTKTRELREETEILTAARAKGGDVAYRAALKDIQAGKIAKDAWKEAAKQGEDATESRISYADALKSEDKTVRDVAMAYKRNAEEQVNWSQSLEAVKSVKNEIKDQTKDILDLEGKLSILRVQETGNMKAASDMELSVKQKAYEFSIKNSKEISASQKETLINLSREIDSRERALAAADRLKVVSDEIAQSQEALAVAYLQSKGSVKEATELSEKFALQEKLRAISAREASGEISSFTALYMRALTLIGAKIKKDGEEALRQKEELRALDDGQMAMEMAILEYGGKTKEMKKLESAHRQRIYELSIRQAVVDGKIGEAAAEQLIRMARITDLMKEAGEGAADQATKVKALYENLARGISSALSEALYNTITDGLKSFSDFFRSIKEMFLKMLAELAAQAITKRVLGPVAAMLGITTNAAGQVGNIPLKDISNADYGTRGLGSKVLGGLGGAVIGGSVGYSSGSAVMGGLSGAASGFAMGGPVGAIIGGIGGIVGGLLGHAKKAREAAKAFAEVNTRFQNSFDEYVKSFRGFYDGFRGEVKKMTDDNKKMKDEAINVFGKSSLGEKIKDFSKFMKLFESDGIGGLMKMRDELAKNKFDVTDLNILIDRLSTLSELDLEAFNKSVKDFTQTITQESNNLNGMGYMNDIFDVQKERDSRLKDDQYLGTGMSDLINSNADTKIKNIVDSLGLPDLYRILPLMGPEIGAWVQSAIDLKIEANKAAKSVADMALAAEAAAKTEELTIDLLKRRAVLSGDSEMMRLAAAAEIKWAYKKEEDSLREMLAAGLITQEFFDEWAQFLKDEMGPAIEAVLNPLEDVFAILQSNLRALSQEAEVFGYSAQEVSRRVDDLYGFAGKSDEDLRAMFIKYSPGSELTAAQIKQNDAVAEALRARSSAAITSASDERSTTESGRTTTNGTVYTGPVTVQISLNVRPEDLRDADRTAAQLANRVDRLLAGKASFGKSADGSL